MKYLFLSFLLSITVFASKKGTCSHTDLDICNPKGRVDIRKVSKLQRKADERYESALEDKSLIKEITCEFPGHNKYLKAVFFQESKYFYYFKLFGSLENYNHWKSNPEYNQVSFFGGISKSGENNHITFDVYEGSAPRNQKNLYGYLDTRYKILSDSVDIIKNRVEAYSHDDIDEKGNTVSLKKVVDEYDEFSCELTLFEP